MRGNDPPDHFLILRTVKPFADTIGLGMFHLGLGVVDIVDRHEELIVVLVRSAAEFRSTIGQNAQNREPMLLVIGKHFVIEHGIAGRNKTLTDPI